MRAFFAHHKPTTAKGRYMLARALLAQGDRERRRRFGALRLAQRRILGAEVEASVIEMFGDMLTRADHKARMEQRLYADDIEAGMRAAERLGGDEVAIAQRARRRDQAGRQREGAARRGARVGAPRRRLYLRARAMAAPGQQAGGSRPADADRAAGSGGLVDRDQWWQERRILVRKLLDEHDAQTAYRVARDAAAPTQGNYRVDKHFTAGWIALRFLHDPEDRGRAFRAHPRGHGQPACALARRLLAGPRRRSHGRPRAGQAPITRRRRNTRATYYGQLARARLGLPDLGLHGPPRLRPEAA